ncbi:hypothetical protein AR546_17155 [Leptospira interrogans serovar Canicola]|nr:hypothetical protein B2G47_04740 [Leptospira interrogans serovar Canicola]OLZ30331.1 hypothetical protein AR546_17155 [Leptospira interrogans serovar Canicola]OQM27017.1 hypothetical protein DV38_20600 [Leptospira interrogans]OQM32479.1 hypothetical protein DV30_04920 [Leptospira interrogans serovar Canicola str. Gui44]POR15219.1 hypothetical protein B0T34_19595 [Leptospira interrogans serovar Canicola]
MYEKNTMLHLFQNLEYEILSKKPTILGLMQFRESFYIFKKLPLIFGTIFMCPNSNCRNFYKMNFNVSRLMILKKVEI